jgi:DNA sulfur modification protein DndD
MAIDLKIASWKSEGLRCPDHEVNFADASANLFPISLIQMPNGTGKTTTLELLRTVLSGSAAEEDWDRKRILSFKKRNSDVNEGLFRVVLLYNDRRITLTLHFDFDNGAMFYSTTLPDSGIEKGFKPPRALLRFLKPSFVNFFVFDGELAEQLLDHTHEDPLRILSSKGPGP